MGYTKEKLNEINLYSLRVLAREMGVKAPTSLNKSNLINEILKIESGKKEPKKPNKKGRPIKNGISGESAKILLDKNAIKKKLIDAILKELEKKLYELL